MRHRFARFAKLLCMRRREVREPQPDEDAEDGYEGADDLQSPTKSVGSRHPERPLLHRVLEPRVRQQRCGSSTEHRRENGSEPRGGRIDAGDEPEHHERRCHDHTDQELPTSAGRCGPAPCGQQHHDPAGTEHEQAERPQRLHGRQLERGHDEGEEHERRVGTEGDELRVPSPGETPTNLRKQRAHGKRKPEQCRSYRDERPDARGDPGEHGAALIAIERDVDGARKRDADHANDDTPHDVAG